MRALLWFGIASIGIGFTVLVFTTDIVTAVCVLSLVAGFMSVHAHLDHGVR